MLHLCTQLNNLLTMSQALQMWPEPAPGSLCALAARLQPEGLALSCKAVHTEPWQTSHRELMAILAA